MKSRKTEIRESKLLGLLRSSDQKHNARQLCQYLDLSNVAVARKLVKGLREEGYPICSDRDGYYYSTDPNDIQSTIHMLKTISNGIGNTVNCLQSIM